MAYALVTATDDAREVIEARLAALWVSGVTPRTPIQYPAVLGLIDTDGGVIMSPPTNAAWLKLDIVWGSTEEATFSVDGSLNRNLGVIQMSLYVPANAGVGALETLKGHARVIFSRFVGSGIRCRASSPGPNFTDAGWMVGIVTTAFECYEEM